MFPSVFVAQKMVKIEEHRSILLRTLSQVAKVKGMKTHRALVIGASGGIGSALCSALESSGAEVSRLSRSVDAFDMTDPASVESVMTEVNGLFDTVLIASGILAPKSARPEKSLAEIDAENMARVMTVNAIGPALVLKNLPRLLPRDSRCVVGILTARVGSISDNHLGGWYSYRAAKAAANQIVRTAAIEIARKRKQAIVVSLHPGTVDTSFTKAYPGHSKMAPTEAAANLIQTLDKLSPDQNGGFFDWAGKPVPW